ncbi:hypothetical protein MANES_06G007150v8 [Manihot esculenta]|uniref:Uncharacterized protein n=1 Tax=Manihot esculenta TaxID=3983 RepID=A0ACB7HFS7_MANES|nr:hypothetical protein MANES_06G007150v8 [Manihot esculenta]
MAYPSTSTWKIPATTAKRLSSADPSSSSSATSIKHLVDSKKPIKSAETSDGSLSMLYSDEEVEIVSEHVKKKQPFWKEILFGSDNPTITRDPLHSKPIPLLDGMLGAIIPSPTWFGVLMSALGVAMLECSGSPPNSMTFFRTEHFSRTTKKENFFLLLGYEILYKFLKKLHDWIAEQDLSPWTWTVMWDWIVAFPWIPALYTGAFSTELCLWVEIAAMHDVSATETAIIYGLEPLWGAGFAWFLLAKSLMAGGSLMVQTFGILTPN